MIIQFSSHTPLTVSHYILTIDTIKRNPCSPSPCGPNSICREINGQPVCSCVAGFLGAPPTCRPECTLSSDCSLSEACSNQKCVNPCPGSCGFRATCNVVNHNPICSCTPDLTGDPFVQCTPRRKQCSFKIESFVDLFSKHEAYSYICF